MEEKEKAEKEIRKPKTDKNNLPQLKAMEGYRRILRTRYILYVKQLLGHKRTEDRLIYTQLVNFESNEYHVRVAKTRAR